jgi:multicomponent Na+:H+ antiporter subunit G
MSDPFSIVMVIVGTGFMLLGTVGVLRMPDVYMRLQVASKASSLGAGCLMLGVATHFGDVGIVVRAILVVIFIFLTTPVSAHLIGRAAYITGVPLWEGTGEDQLRDGYDAERGTLRGIGEGADERDAEPDADAPPDARASDGDGQASGDAT